MRIKCIKNPRKRLFKSKELCCSVDEVDSRFLSCLTSIFSTRANRRSESHKQGFKLWWTDSAEGKLQTNMCSIREIDLIGVFLFCRFNDGRTGNWLTKIVYHQFCKDLLKDEVHLFWRVSKVRTACTLIAERSFPLAPGKNLGHQDSLRIANQIYRPPEVEVLDRLYVCQCLL